MNDILMKSALFNSDRYQYTMGKVFTKTGKSTQDSVFDVFFRKAPDGNNWAVVSGISEVLDLINIMNSDIYNREEKYDLFIKLFNDKEYAELLADLKFTGTIYAMKEGELVFPNEPFIILTGELLQCQLLETPILSIINHQFAVASAASRVTRAAKGIPVSSFGSRRAHGPWSAIYGDKASWIAGCSNGSNIMTEYNFGVPSVGTMAHSFIEAYGPTKEGELQAFNDFVQYNPGKANMLLIDTYDVLKSGLPNAIKVFKEYKLEYDKSITYGIRLDSGDLAYLSKKCREEFDKHELYNAKIMVTNGLDEYLIKDLLDQESPIDIIGCGDRLSCAKTNPCFGGVFKLAQIDDQPTIKLSEDSIKIINPGFKQIYRIYQDGEPKADLIALKNNDTTVDLMFKGKPFIIRDEKDRFKQTTFEKDTYCFKELLTPIVINGEIQSIPSVQEAREYYLHNLKTFSEEHTRLLNPHFYKVDLSDDLYDLKINLISNLKSNI